MIFYQCEECNGHTIWKTYYAGQDKYYVMLDGVFGDVNKLQKQLKVQRGKSL